MGLLTLFSCKSQYMVKGFSNVDDLEGKMLTLKVYVDGEMRSIDSTRVVHGRFSFGGSMDSTMLANVFWGNLSLMPIVLEEGEVDLRISETQQSATGTPLNDTLSGFIQRKTQLDARMAELPHLESQMIMDGTDYDEIMYELGTTHPPTMVFVAYSFSSFPFDSFPLLAFIFVYMVIYLYFHHELPQGRNHVHLSHYPISRAQMSVRVGAQ